MGRAVIHLCRNLARRAAKPSPSNWVRGSVRGGVPHTIEIDRRSRAGINNGTIRCGVLGQLQFCVPRTGARCSLLFYDRKLLFGEHATLVPYLESPDARYKLPVMLETIVSV
jgi:hypothetical protein